MFLIIFLPFMCMEVIFRRNYFKFFVGLKCSTLACSSLIPPPCLTEDRYKVCISLEDDKEMSQETAPVIETKV